MSLRARERLRLNNTHRIPQNWNQICLYTCTDLDRYAFRTTYSSNPSVSNPAIRPKPYGIPDDLIRDVFPRTKLSLA